jgi:hypothetical protein
MRTNVNADVYSHVFDSLGDMLDSAAQGVRAPDAANSGSGLAKMLAERARENGNTWTYGELQNAETYLRVLAEGWSAAIPRVEALVGKIAPTMASPLDVRRKLKRGPQGDDYDMHRARSGQFDKAWTARRRAVAQAPAPVRILCNTVFNAGVSAEAFFWKGACALALSQALRRTGYRVAISGVGLLLRPFNDTKRHYLARFDALSYGEAPDTARLASILCSSATLRHVLFRTALLVPHHVCGSYGQAPYDDESVTRQVVASGVFPPRNEERLLIPQQIGNERNAGEWLREVSAKFA